MGILNFPNTNLKYAARDAALVSLCVDRHKILVLNYFFVVCFIVLNGFYAWIIVCALKEERVSYSCGCAALIP